METNETDDVAVRRLGSRSLGCGTIHAVGCPSSFVASWPAVTSSLEESLVAVERDHGSGSMMVMG
jgi:hypothetical protein